MEAWVIACIVFVFAALMEYTGILLQVTFDGHDGDVHGGGSDVHGGNDFGDCQQFSLKMRNQVTSSKPQHAGCLYGECHV